MRLTLVVHVAAGMLGIVSGFVALYAAKGAALHRKSGMLFVYAMLTMAVTATAIAAFRGIETSVAGGLLTAYMVITALTAVRPPAAGWRWLDLGGMLVALAIGLTNLMWGFESVAKGESTRHGGPVPMLFVFGAIALAAGASDVRVIRSGGLQGAARLARHVWRMCFAVFIASASFFLGQASKFPEQLRIPALLAIPVLLPLLAMVYWLWRLRIRKSFRGIVGVRSPAAT
ncbi:MAG TPA: hypothetical protein VKY89_03765 [Thermoanaerobaculia bacterium]|nr:hypothetical protein [Thermoanaerobaculia bacterium]